MKDIAQRIKQLRTSNRMDQDDMARLLGIKRAAYSKIECGINKISTDYVIKLATNFNVTTDWLLTGKQNSTSNQPGDFDISTFGKYKSIVLLMLTEMSEDVPLLLKMLKNYHHEKMQKELSIENSIENKKGEPL